MTADRRNESSGSLSSLVSKISNISTGSKTSIYGVVKKNDLILEDDEENDESLNDGSEGEEMRYMFSHLQAFSACLDAFAHGGNDVGNSIGPVLALWSAFSAGNLLFGQGHY
ncbi:Oidioi.mRNA.OKI2018_I69.chr2.g7401.t1.cds [Oikopleura dioica]|uniref:Oidioi.mRNA.OKI2018_I69.chr2.g7401.t1.cds n=1 Tax=Oikopleura dioica TaxID=34765 RepID=A0ABN7T9L2_OIKDI|nr:Oidioi.mRNA.OKI2018_I69.chr2.g7401.t1.cds [Oikopleura dioica]